MSGPGGAGHPEKTIHLEAVRVQEVRERLIEAADEQVTAAEGRGPVGMKSTFPPLCSG